MEYHDMTDEEYETLADEFARNPPKINTRGIGWIKQWEIRHLGLQNMTINYLFTKARAANKNPVEIIDDLVREKVLTPVI